MIANELRLLNYENRISKLKANPVENAMLIKKLERRARNLRGGDKK